MDNRIKNVIKGKAKDDPNLGPALDLFYAFANLTTEELSEIQTRIGSVKDHKQISTNHYNDLQSVLTRVAGIAALKLSAPRSRPRDPSPLHHGEDSRQIIKDLMSRSKDRKEASRTWLSDVKKRYPGFRSNDPTSPGFLEYDRVRQCIRNNYNKDGTPKSR